jgi:hypothetical protein
LFNGHLATSKFPANENFIPHPPFNGPMKIGFRILISMLAVASCGNAAGREQSDARALVWKHDKTSLALLNQEKTVWRLVFDPEQPKSYFHPLASIDGQVMTAFEPDDHPWHRGLWWSWKYINGVNYWEENPKTRTSAGLTQLTHAMATPADDFSARVELDFEYHPPDQKPVLTEKRQLSISKPDAAGTYVIDWKSRFTATDLPVTFDRTLPLHLGGVAHGGYAGLSLRMAKGLDDFSFQTHEGKTTAAASHGKPARWVDLTSPGAGIAILDHAGNLRHAPPWYVYSGKQMQFFSPAPLFNEALMLAPGESITMTYQIIIHSEALTPGRIEDQWRAFNRLESTKP